MFEQTDHRDFIHRIDREGTLCDVNAHWLAFAAENGWQVRAADVLGQPMLDFVTGAETRHLYTLLMRRCRAGSAPLAFSYRCDAPDCRRLLRMEMSHDPAQDVFTFHSRVLRIERRESVPLLSPHRAAQDALPLSICSWCKSVWTGDAWVEVEQAVMRLRLFVDELLPPLSHGICPSCNEHLLSLTTN